MATKRTRSTGLALPLEEALRGKVVAHLKNHKSTLGELSKKYKMSADDILSVIDILRKEDVKVVTTQFGNADPLYYVNVLPDARNVYFISGPDEKRREMDFGAISDIHFASVFHLPKSFHEAMRRLEDKGVRRVYIAGDVIDGTHIYKGHEVNLASWTVDGETDIAAEALSKHPNLDFWAIAGNHDYSFTQQNGIRPLAVLERKIPNFRNLGDFRADVVYHGIKIRLLHGGGGRAYATSYPSQIYLRDYFRGLEPEEISNAPPHILLLGHFHTYYQGFDHGVLILQAGSFQDGDNEYCARRGLTGPTGALHVSLKYANGVIDESTTTYIKPKAASKEKGVAFAKTVVNYDDNSGDAREVA